MKTTLLALLFLPLLAVGQSTIAKEGGPTDIHYTRGDHMAPLSLALLEERRAFVPEVNRAAFDMELQSIRTNKSGAPLLLLGLVATGAAISVPFIVEPPSKPLSWGMAGASTAGTMCITAGILRLSHKREARRRATWLYYETYVWQ